MILARLCGSKAELDLKVQMCSARWLRKRAALSNFKTKEFCLSKTLLVLGVRFFLFLILFVDVLHVLLLFLLQKNC